MAPKPTHSASLGFQLTLAARLYRTHLARELSNIGLFPGQEQVLRALGAVTEGLAMGDLARALQVQPPTLTKTIQRLQSQELILRMPRAGDGRVVHLLLTPAGQDKLARVIEAESRLERDLSSLFKPKTEKRLRRSLRRLAKHLAPQNDALLDADSSASDDAADED